MLKKLLLLPLTLLLSSVAIAQTYTPNLNLGKPNRGSISWDSIINGNWDKMDSWAGTVCPKVGACTFGGPLTGTQLGADYQVDQFGGSTFDAQLTACITALPTATGGTCNAKNVSNLTMAANVTVSVANTVILLPCKTITAGTFQLIVPVGIRGTKVVGCSHRGGSNASGTAGGSVWTYTGSGAAVQVGDPTFAADTQGFSIEDVNFNITGSSAIALAFYRTQEINAAWLYLNGDTTGTTGEVGILLNGTGNYSGGTFDSNTISQFQYAIELAGNTTGGGNASQFTRQHINCPTSSGTPVSGTAGVYIAYGDGNNFTGGDIETCAVTIHLGAGAINNKGVGVRNEQGTQQVLADSGSNNNDFEFGTPMYNNGAATNFSDSGSLNSFRSANTYAFNPQKGTTTHDLLDQTGTDHSTFGIGLGNERGHVREIATDYELYSGTYRWTEGYSDGTTGIQSWAIHDGINNVDRFNAGQYLTSASGVLVAVMSYNGGCYNSATAPTISITGGGGTGAAVTANMVATTSASCNGGSGWTIGSYTITAAGSSYTSNPTLSTGSPSNQLAAPHVLVGEVSLAGSTNNQTVVNSAGTGAVVINGVAAAGTGGLIIGSGSANAGNAALTVDDNGQINHYAAVGSPTTINDEFWLGGVDYWIDERGTTSYAVRCNNCTTATNMITAFLNGGVNINGAAGGANGLSINNSATSGTGNLTLYEGAANYNTAAWTATAAGVTTQISNANIGTASGTGNVVIGNHLNQYAANDYSGQCTVATSAASCSVSFQHSWTTPDCHATPMATSGTAAAILTILATNPYLVVPGSGSAAVYMNADPSTAITFSVTCIGDPN